MIKINNKKGLQFKSAFFAIIALSMIVIATGIIIDDWNTEYDSGLTYDLAEYSELDSLSSEANRQQGNISVKSSVEGEDFEGTTLRAVFGILNNIYKPFKIIFGEGGMLDSVTDRFGIPNYVRQGLVTMMILAITFAIIAILFRLPRTTT